MFNIGKNMGNYFACMLVFFHFIFNGAFVGTAYFATKSVADGTLTYGEVAAYLLYNWTILFNVLGLITNLEGVAKVQGAFYEIACLVTEPKQQIGYYDKGKAVTPEMLNAEEGTINLVDIEFNYPSKVDVPVLKRINIDVQNCQTVALVGHSGCGKSSIIALIERFYDPQEGQVLFNKKDIQEMDSKWYHQ